MNLVGMSSNTARAVQAFAKNGITKNRAATDAAADTTSAKDSNGTGTSAVDDFRAFMKMSPMQRMRANILSRMGMTEEQLGALGPEERTKAEETIKAQIKATIAGGVAGTQSTGLLLDRKA